VISTDNYLVDKIYEADGFLLQNVSSYGLNCFFYALQHQLSREGHKDAQFSVKDLRSIVANYYKGDEFKDKEFKFANSATVSRDQWVAQMLSNGRGDSLYTPKALAKALDIEVHIFCCHENQKFIRKVGSSPNKVFIFYKNGHFQSVLGAKQEVIDEFKSRPDEYQDLIFAAQPKLVISNYIEQKFLPECKAMLHEKYGESKNTCLFLSALHKNVKSATNEVCIQWERNYKKGAMDVMKPAELKEILIAGLEAEICYAIEKLDKHCDNNPALSEEGQIEYLSQQMLGCDLNSVGD
jgi:hypothetical protein